MSVRNASSSIYCDHIDAQKWSLVSVNSALKKIESVLALMKEETTIRLVHMDAEEVVQWSHIFQGELVVDGDDHLTKHSCGQGGDHNIVDIEKKVCRLAAALPHEQGSIRMCRSEAQLAEERGEALVPSPRSLFELI